MVYVAVSQIVQIAYRYSLNPLALELPGYCDGHILVEIEFNPSSQLVVPSAIALVKSAGVFPGL